MILCPKSKIRNLGFNARQSKIFCILLLAPLFLFTSCGAKKDYITNLGPQCAKDDLECQERKKKKTSKKDKQKIKDSEKAEKNTIIDIEVFLDLRCTPCRLFWEDLKKLKGEFENEADFVFYQYPLSYEKDAKRAAIASICAKDQDAFWEYLDKVLSFSGDLGNEDFVRFAEDLSLNLEPFQSCLSSKERELEVNKDKEIGKKREVFDVPTVFVDGKRFKGKRSYAFLKREIEDTIKKYDKS